MRVLVTGAGGQLGHDVAAVCRAAGDQVAALDRAALDVTDRDQVLAAAGAVAPDAIVHCAAWTAVDACETDPERAFVANALAVRHVAEAARRTGAHLVHLSTDYVFDGTLERPYHEWDEPDPVNVYGRSKLAGEHEALAGCPGATVVRTSWVVGAHGANVVRTILALAADPDRPLAFVDDQRGSPTCTADLAPLLRTLARDRRPGVVHATNQGVTTWYGLARATLEAAGADPSRVRAVTTAELDPPRPARRPASSVLAPAVLLAWGLPLLPPWRRGVERLVAQLAGSPPGPDERTPR
ncbi:MAG: dTDP-4-dehydrorhamnose reductase [Acidimicrobiales bacterium]|nr:dTDP-4-dehydrorhamnose reductase [Acidimicrobiales bacterium]